MNRESQLHRYLDGELSPEEESRFLGELTDDSDLAAQLSSLQQGIEWHRESIPQPKDAAFIDAELEVIHQRIQSGEKNSKLISFPMPGWTQSIGIAAALLLTVTGLWFWNQDESIEETYLADSIPSVGFVETDIEGASSMIYMDRQTGWTIVWVDEPEPGPSDSMAG